MVCKPPNDWQLGLFGLLPKLSNEGSDCFCQVPLIAAEVDFQYAHPCSFKCFSE